MWTKPVGFGYTTNMTLVGGDIHKNKSFKQGVSPVLVKGFTNLEPNTTYTVSIKRECTDKPTVAFDPVTTTVTTFPVGMFANLCVLKVHTWYHCDCDRFLDT